MNLISCVYCGVVLDQTHLSRVKEWDEETQEYYEQRILIGREWFNQVLCPVCNNMLRIEEKQ